jgi:hypothetical protein
MRGSFFDYSILAGELPEPPTTETVTVRTRKAK